jgi:hypothetical protein
LLRLRPLRRVGEAMSGQGDARTISRLEQALDKVLEENAVLKRERDAAVRELAEREGWTGYLDRVLREHRELTFRLDIAQGLLDDYDLMRDYEQAFEEAATEARMEAMEP